MLNESEHSLVSGNAIDSFMSEDLDDNLPAMSSSFDPLAILKKQAYSKNVSERQNAVRNLLKTMQSVEDDENDVPEVFYLIEHVFALDEESIVRTELLEQVPMLTLHCCSQALQPYLCGYKRSVLLPIVLQFLNNDNVQIRKTSYSTVSVLLEQELLTTDEIEHCLMPVLLRLSTVGYNTDDVRVECVQLLCKLVSILGRDKTIRLLLSRFTELCIDSLSHIRKTCAAHIGEICKVLGAEMTEKVLVPHLIALSQDAMWGVRKSCAECFPDVSNFCTMQTRRHQLAPIFIVLLADNSRWVQSAAFQGLGQFISTFADSNRTGLEWIDGHLAYNEHQLKEEDEKQRKHEVTSSSQYDPYVDKTTTTTDTVDTDSSATVCQSAGFKSQPSPVTTVVVGGDSADVTVKPKNVSEEILDNVTKDLESPDSVESPSQQTQPPSVDVSFEGHVETSISASPTEQKAPLSLGDQTIQCSPPSNADGFGVDDIEGAAGVATNMDTVLKSPINIPVADDSSISTETNSNTTTSNNTVSVKEASLFASFKFWRPTIPLATTNATKSPEKNHSKKSATVTVAPSECADEKVVDDTVTHLDRGGDRPTTLVESFMERHLRFAAAGISSPTDEFMTPPKLAASSASSPDKKSVVPNSSPAATVVLDQENQKISSSRNVSASLQENITNSLDAPFEIVAVDIVDDDQLHNSVDPTVLALSILSDCGKRFRSRNRQALLAESDGSDDEVADMSLLSLSFNKSLEPVEMPKDFEYQDIIPQALLDQFLSMVEPSRAQSIENDISRHCAFNFPAVAFTIGRQHWPLIKATYVALSNDMQWKVRRTLAFSIHNLAAILGPEITTRDLLPVFTGFLRDLDEVRIGVLKNLAEFLRLLTPPVRSSLLCHLADFLQTENYRNWRFRYLFAEQLILLCDLFAINDVNEYLSPIAMTLAIDKVAEIRQITYKLMSTILSKFYWAERRRNADENNSNGTNNIGMPVTDTFVQDIIKGFARSQRWVRRQTFVYICRQLAFDEVMSHADFAHNFIPTLVSMSFDRIANVRIALAHVLRLVDEHHCDVDNDNSDNSYSNTSANDISVPDTLKRLANDRDRDVRHASLGASVKCSVGRCSYCSYQPMTTPSTMTSSSTLGGSTNQWRRWYDDVTTICANTATTTTDTSHDDVINKNDDDSSPMNHGDDDNDDDQVSNGQHAEPRRWNVTMTMTSSDNVGPAEQGDESSGCGDVTALETNQNEQQQPEDSVTYNFDFDFPPLSGVQSSSSHTNNNTNGKTPCYKKVESVKEEEQQHQDEPESYDWN